MNCARAGRPGWAARLRTAPWAWAACLFSFLPAGALRAQDVTATLPRYGLDIQLLLEQQRVVVRERVTWTNTHARATSRIVFNAHSHYTTPDKDVGFLAKLLEVLRLAPSEVFDFEGPPCQVATVSLLAGPSAAEPVESHAAGRRRDLPFAFQDKIDTALEVALPGPVGPGESITLELVFTLRLPQKQGRWGQWRGVTSLAQWLPVLAYYDNHGWQPVPFIPWHQPFFNEAGLYHAHITYPAGQKLASSGPVRNVRSRGDGWEEADVEAGPVRDFALLCSADYRERIAQAGHVAIRCLALPGHDFYAEQALHIVCEALPIYERWFGRFPYDHFTLVESYFGWNGNECGGLVMIDERVFGMPHLAANFVDLLVSHELCHQWWYNAVGTNGYAETWMDEGLATYFSHRLMDRKHGKNNSLITYPPGLGWLPEIHRDDYRNYSYLGVRRRGEESPTVQELPGFVHLVNLEAMTYDRGSKIVGMIEARLGEPAFFDFMRLVYAKYRYRILRVEDFRAELEAFTGRPWKEFFEHWLYGTAMTDWCLDSVRVEEDTAGARPGEALPGSFLAALRPARLPSLACRVVIDVHQQGQCSEPTVLGICLRGDDSYQVRIPLIPGVPLLEVDEPRAKVESLGQGRMRVEVSLPRPPTQVAIDPDEVLLDSDPTNNYWKPRCRLRVTPVYFQLDETDLTNAYDRLNLIFGPWLYGAAYSDPWYTRSPMLGLRAGLYRTQQYSGGTYLAYRTDDRNVVAGVDGVIDHWPLPHTQLGFNVERSLATLGGEETSTERAVVYGRYIINYSASLYLPPIHYVETFAAVQNRFLPEPRHTLPDAQLFNDQTVTGLHYHLDYLTPYWDPEGGLAIDWTYQEGLPALGEAGELHQVFGQVSAVTTMPAWLGFLKEVPGLAWVLDTRLAGRVYGAAALPENAQVFALGGGDHFRGFDLGERQGNLVWLASLEWRMPLARGLRWDCCDHVAGLRNVYAATFYDVGDAYLNNHSFGPVAHAAGLGLRLDVAWFSMIERTILRFDVAKAIGPGTPVQFWFGVRQPF